MIAPITRTIRSDIPAPPTQASRSKEPDQPTDPDQPTETRPNLPAPPTQASRPAPPTQATRSEDPNQPEAAQAYLAFDKKKTARCYQTPRDEDSHDTQRCVNQAVIRYGLDIGLK